MEKRNNKVNIRVEFEPSVIRHCAIQCPNCNTWFHQVDISTSKRFAITESDLYAMDCHCQKCGHDFELGTDYVLEESEHPQIYKDCVKKIVHWE